MPSVNALARLLSTKRFGRWPSTLSKTPRKSNLDAPVESEFGSTRKPQGWRRMIRNCARSGVARQWTILCFLINGTFILVLFVLLFVEIPEGQFISVRCRLTIGREAVETNDSTPATNVSTWLGKTSRTVIPRACHSHNDYNRKFPVFTALTAGCTGIEADVWLSSDGKDLLIGHERDSLTSTRTLQSMYINPLLEILNGQNPTWAADSMSGRPQGIFPTQPNSTVVLLVDVKEKPEIVWPLVIQQLEPLRQRRFLTRHEQAHPTGLVDRQTLWPAPLTVVGSGQLKLPSLLEAYPNGTFMRYHDTFVDAPLNGLPDADRPRSANTSTSAPMSWGRTLYGPDNSYYASVSFKQTIGSVMLGFSQSQLDKLRAQIRGAQQSGLVSRYWDTPSWPINYRDYIWGVLTREGVGILNVDDVAAATRGVWTEGYLKSVHLIIATSLYTTAISVIVWVVGLHILRTGSNDGAPDFLQV
ncbi:hypothetical protein F4802DRAFT_598403 [Xylaria palmicola]|nr:hypothetical protein F4802DRAFT_598403 [Xylaria palmicola]